MCLLIFSNSTSAQIIIKGVVTDSVMKTPIPMAYISVLSTNSKEVIGKTITDNKGDFIVVIDKPKTKHLKVITSANNYKQLHKAVTLASNNETLK